MENNLLLLKPENQGEHFFLVFFPLLTHIPIFTRRVRKGRRRKKRKGKFLERRKGEKMKKKFKRKLDDRIPKADLEG